MKYFVGLVIVFLAATAVAEGEYRSPLDVVNARMAAYNNHDIDAFLSLYSNDVQIFTFPNVALNSGSDNLRSIFEPMFKEAEVSVKIHQQITQGRYVINHETVMYAGNGQKYVSIYEVKDGLITSVQFVRE